MLIKNNVMEITHTKTRKMSWGSTFKGFSLIFIFFFSALNVTFSQATDSLPPDTTAMASGEGAGPSLENITKNLEQSAAELEKIRHEEIMSYIYMGVGFSIVIGIAWFTTVLARKRKRKEDEVRAIRMQQMKHHKPHHHPRR